MSELSAVYSSSSSYISCQNREKSAKDLMTLSSTDEKIYKIAGGILIGTAFVIGAASLYAAFFISATYAWGLGLALACGAIGGKILNAYAPADSQNGRTSPTKKSSSSESVEGIRRQRADFVPGQPVGIRNGSCNCWTNSLLQFARHIPSLYNLVQTDPDLQPAFGNFYQAYDAAGEAHHHVATRASSQTIRQCLHGINADISTRSGRQEDAHEGLMAMMRNSPPTYVRVQRAIGDQVEPITVTSINPNGHRGRPLAALFEQSMIREDEAGGAFVYFQNRPDELFLHINRFQPTGSGTYAKNRDLLNIGPTFTLPGRRVDTGEGGEYECDAFIEHTGRSMAGGHYIAYVVDANGQWWLCDDDDVTAVSDAEVAQARRRAYILHFRAV